MKTLSGIFTETANGRISYEIPDASTGIIYKVCDLLAAHFGCVMAGTPALGLEVTTVQLNCGGINLTTGWDPWSGFFVFSNSETGDSLVSRIGAYLDALADSGEFDNFIQGDRSIMELTQKRFIELAALNLAADGYVHSTDPEIPGVKALLYARSPLPHRLGFARVEDHFLIVDWDNAMFGRLELLQKTYRDFSKFVNCRFRVPHALRMTIPNLAVVAISRDKFPDTAVQYVQRTYLNPWQGGETGQFMLVDLAGRAVTCHLPPPNRQPGGFPLLSACETIERICGMAFNAPVE